MAGYSVVQQVGFGVIGDEENRRNGVAEITSYEIYNAEGRPVTAGVGDLRLGTVDHGFRCVTCAYGKKLCPGHRGFLRLRAGVLQAIGVAEARRWLRVACHACGEIVVGRDKYAHLPPAARLAAAATVPTEGQRCPRRGCGAVHPRVTRDEEDHFTFWVEPPAPRARTARGERAGRGADARKLYPDTMRAIFERVSDSACEALGRALDAHPRKLVLRVLNVPPNTSRPGVKNYGGAGNSYNDSTSLLQNLVKRNELLPAQLPEVAVAAAGAPGAPPGAPVPATLDNALQNLQQIYYDLVMGSSGTSATQGSSGRRGLVVGSRPVHSFLRNLPRKEGRIRANLLGKRVFFISRSTISGNMRFRIDEVGVPLEFARTLQVEEVVQEYNRDWLMPFFLNGRRRYPGSTYLVRRATDEAHDVAGLRDARLEVGDRLFRDVVTGDVALFNRQPSLERSNIGAHRVIVLQDPGAHTFQLNVLACGNYGADFSRSPTGGCLGGSEASPQGKQCKLPARHTARYITA